jgi:hypothetical protein
MQESFSAPGDIRERTKTALYFQTLMCPAWQCCERLKYHDILALSRIAGHAPQHLKM